MLVRVPDIAYDDITHNCRIVIVIMTMKKYLLKFIFPLVILKKLTGSSIYLIGSSIILLDSQVASNEHEKWLNSQV